MERDTNRFPRENLERVLEFSFPSPSEASMSQYEIECAICYTLLQSSVVNDRYQLDVQGKTILPEKTCPNEKISTLSAR